MQLKLRKSDKSSLLKESYHSSPGLNNFSLYQIYNKWSNVNYSLGKHEKQLLFYTKGSPGHQY